MTNTCKTCKHADYADEYIDDDFIMYECMINPPLINQDIYKREFDEHGDKVIASRNARVVIAVEEFHRCGKWEMK